MAFLKAQERTKERLVPFQPLSTHVEVGVCVGVVRAVLLRRPAGLIHSADESSSVSCVMRSCS